MLSSKELWGFRVVCLAMTVLLARNSCSFAQVPANPKRDTALARVNACLKRNETSNKVCKHFNRNVETLVEVYREGDKSVLPTLLQLAYLTDFYDESLAADPEGFLTAVSKLSDKGQEAVAAGIAGDRMFGLRERAQFHAVRSALRSITRSSSNFQLAQMCLKKVEATNAVYLVSYFPPAIFPSRAGDLKVRYFSQELYGLGVRPMWPPASASGFSCRVTVLPSFGPPESVSVTVTPDGSGQAEYRTTDAQRQSLSVDAPRRLSPVEISNLKRTASSLPLSELPVEVLDGPTILDGVDWILECVQNGRYFIVVRTCPGKTPLGEAERQIFELSGHKAHGVC